MVLYILTALSLRTYKLDKLMPQIKGKMKLTAKNMRKSTGRTDLFGLKRSYKKVFWNSTMGMEKSRADSII